MLTLIAGLHFRLRAVPCRRPLIVVRGSMANSSQQAIVSCSRLVPRIRDGSAVTPQALANNISHGLSASHAAKS